MISKLTKELEIKLYEFREYCYKEIGLNTQKLDKKNHWENFSKLYKDFLGHELKYIWYCDSPFQYNLIINILYNISPNLRENLRANLQDNLGANLQDNLRDNLQANLWENLGDNLRENLWENLGANLRDNLRDNLQENLRENLRENLWTNLQENLQENLRENLWENLRDNLQANLWANLWENLQANLWENLWDNLQENLGANLWENLQANLQENLQANLRENFEENKLFFNVYWSNTDIYWISYYLFPKLYLGINYGEKNNRQLNYMYEIIKDSGQLFFHKEILFITERPIEIHLNDQKQLHANGRPAMIFRDGYSLYMLNGVRVPKELVLTPAEKIDCQKWIKEKNVEIRREFIRKVGNEKLCKDLNSKKIDECKDVNGNPLELLELDLEDNIKGKYLKMINPSLPGIYHIECVHPDCKTAFDADMWRRDQMKEKPVVLT